MFENTFPAGRFVGEKFWASERIDNALGIRLIAVGQRRAADEFRQVPQPAGCNGCSGLFVGQCWVRFIPIVGERRVQGV